MSTTTVYPNGDASTTGWTDETTLGLTNLNAKVSEGTVSPNDSTYVDLNAGLQPISFNLADMPSDFSVATAVSVVVRGLKSGSGSRTFTVQLFQSDGTTALTGTAVSSTASAGFTNFTMAPTITGATDKTSWDGAILKITPTGSSSPETQISATQVTITYTASSFDATQGFFLLGA